ncbi:MAG TPA: TlpA disulfide reductase family protein [Longimicrobiales bacterium]|nr:TlpA disulfide reductase family protein [Longimicrobiales bacterium]
MRRTLRGLRAALRRGPRPARRARARAAALLLVVSAGAVAAGGCFLDDGVPIPRVGMPAIPYGAHTLAGDSMSLDEFRGDVVLLNLWATWCVPCRTETPYLQSLHEEHADEGLRVVGVSVDDRTSTDLVADFVEEFGVTYTVLHDPQGRGLTMWVVPGLPASFLIDREGILRWLRYGPIPEGDPELLAALDELLS